ncbi:MAG: hypothetical protein KDA51_09395 [Planctomycetales bacterium]|nr:hypothetical protein [Planctomycetales bacterium]
MSLFKGKKQAIAGAMAALAAIGMLSACTGNGVDGKSPAPGQSVAQSTASQSQPTSTPASDPRTADGFIRDFDVLIGSAATADELEKAAANSYCDVERKFGENSPELQQVVKATAEHYGQSYMYHAQTLEGLTLNNDSGLLKALGTFALAMLPPSSDPGTEAYYQKSRDEWAGLSFCKVAAEQVPSAIHPQQAPKPAESAPIADTVEAYTAEITQRLAAAQDDRELFKSYYRPYCEFVDRHGKLSADSSQLEMNLRWPLDSNIKRLQNEGKYDQARAANDAAMMLDNQSSAGMSVCQAAQAVYGF